MNRSFQSSTVSLLLAGLFLASCGGDAPDSGSAEAERLDEPQAEASVGTAPATVEDIGRWEKGMAAELAAVRESGAKLNSAKNGEDTLSALMGVQEMSTVSTGARAAGLDPERYKVVRSNLSAAVAYLTPHLGGIDTTLLSPEQRDEMRRMNAAQLEQLRGAVPADVVEALKPRAEALRKQELELIGARLKGAGM